MVSKNGNLLLNVPLTPDGTLEQESIDILTTRAICLQIMGEAVFKTRPGSAWARGPAVLGKAAFRSARPATSVSRGTRKSTVLYATAMGWPGDGRPLKIKTLNSTRFDLKTLSGIAMLGGPDKLEYRQDAEALYVSMPAMKPFESYAYALKLTFSRAIPELKAGTPPTILAAADGSFVLIAEDAALHGMGARSAATCPPWPTGPRGGLGLLGSSTLNQEGTLRCRRHGGCPQPDVLGDRSRIAEDDGQTASDRRLQQLPRTCHGPRRNQRAGLHARDRPARAETWHAINLAKVILTPQK